MRKTFYTFEQAAEYQRFLRTKGINSNIYSAYNWSEQKETYTVVPNNKEKEK